MKFNFFAKKGRPTLIEQEVCKKILNLVKQEVVTESEIQDYINKNGTANSFEDLEFLHTYLTGEVPIEEYSNSSLYSDTKEDNFEKYDFELNEDLDEVKINENKKLHFP